MGYTTPSAWIIEGGGPEIHTAQKTASSACLSLNHKNNPGEEEVVVDAPNNPKEIFSTLIQRCENLTSFLDES
jgi:hypothetical protein